MKKVITTGCSYTKYKWQCWPNFLSWFENGYDIKNLGAAGNSNELIMRSVYNAINKWKSSIEKVYIMWSGTNRYEIVHDKIDQDLKKDDELLHILVGIQTLIGMFFMVVIIIKTNMNIMYVGFKTKGKMMYVCLKGFCLHKCI